MKKYLVSALCIVSIEIEAGNEEEAVEKYLDVCGYDVESNTEIAVTDLQTGEQICL